MRLSGEATAEAQEAIDRAAVVVALDALASALSSRSEGRLASIVTDAADQLRGRIGAVVA